MNILIGGGTGLIGHKLAHTLTQKNNQHKITNVSRKRGNQGTITWDDVTPETISQYNAVVQLAGQRVMDKWWTDSVKKNLISSRVETTNKIVDSIFNLKESERPSVFVLGSAIGFYPLNPVGQTFDDYYDGIYESGFAGQLVEAMERTVKPLEELGIRTVKVRTGIVLDKEDGAFPQLKTPVGWTGTIGDGSHAFPWIHVDDLTGIFAEAIEDDRYSGVINGVAPDLVTQKKFAEVLGETYNTYTIPVPKIMMKAILGERSVLVTEGNTVVPKKLEELNYNWRYRTLPEALLSLK
eukprot:TRINITY_DN12908_c0_g1_i1.p1 TRINITY_DN12908_c0_g1~~TRINITY_DN12908_c0_g1_i1.p1  ORF type:complete len:295 (+),score=72.79 TRINITY_DN12908_c0_g1_i1:30-914(+)